MIQDKVDYRPMDDGVLLFNDIDLIKAGEINDAAYKLWRNIDLRPKSIVVELNTYRKYVPVVLKFLDQCDKVLDAAGKMTERFSSDNQDKKYKRWADDEDKILIDLICQDPPISMLELSTTMGRTVPAIKTRISKLVGLKRIKQEVAGRFLGTVDGLSGEWDIAGTVYKKEG